MLDAPLEQMLARAQINDRQYEALRLLRLHWFLGHLASGLRAADLNRVPGQPGDGLEHNERELLHRQAFRAGWVAMSGLERGTVSATVLTETAGLTSVGVALGYSSPYRGRMAALELVQSAANTLAKIWNI
jgi:hypothetical protein